MANSGRSLYQRYLQVVSRWPIDPTKEGRDLGVSIRSRVGELFPQGELSNFSSEQLPAITKEVEAFERITSNANQLRYSHYKDGYTAATGLHVDMLRDLTSTEAIKEMEQLDKLSRYGRFKLQIELTIESVKTKFFGS